MKIIEGLKQIKDLQRKANDLRSKIGMFSAYRSLEQPVYPDQKRQIAEWLQSHKDIVAEILKLYIAIQRTNLETQVDIMIDNKTITKSIAEWIHRRRSLAELERKAWSNLTDKNLQEGYVMDSQGERREVKIVRCYDPVERDKKVEKFTSEPSLIDARLEMVNAVTDLIM